MMPISLIWMAVFTYPEGMEGWQYYRIEYGGHAMACLTEGGIWLPPNGDPDEVEAMLRKMQCDTKTGTELCQDEKEDEDGSIRNESR